MFASKPRFMGFFFCCFILELKRKKTETRHIIDVYPRIKKRKYIFETSSTVSTSLFNILWSYRCVYRIVNCTGEWDISEDVSLNLFAHILFYLSYLMLPNVMYIRISLCVTYNSWMWVDEYALLDSLNVPDFFPSPFIFFIFSFFFSYNILDDKFCKL